MSTPGRLLARTTSLATLIAGIAIALMMLHVSLDVAFRYLLGAPLPGTLTIVTYYYMVIAAFVPLAFAELRRAHISKEIVTDLLPRRGRNMLEGWMLVPTGLVTGLLTWRGFEEALKQQAIGAAQIQGSSSIPIWPAYYALPLGAGLMTLLVIYRFVNFLRRRPDDLPAAASDREAGL